MVACERMFNSAIRRTALVIGAALVLALSAAAPAGANVTAIIQACNAGASLSGFSKAELEEALKNLPADSDQYSDCSGMISAALLDKASGSKVPGGKGKGIKGQKAELRAASVKDLTTSAERKKASEEAAEATKIGKGDPLSSAADPAIRAAAGNTLASTTAPNTPVALIIGLIGLVLLLGADLFGRLGGPSRVKKLLPGSGERDSD